MNLEIGQRVEHRTDLALGQGDVRALSTIGGIQRAIVQWSNKPGVHEHPVEDLNPIVPLPERLAQVGPASRIPFQLKVLGRWFEARHGLTGELSNQPFQMLPHQVIITNRVVNSAPDNRAWLIADDVGLGKTIEAGMILEVLRKKSLGRFRCLIVTPAGLMPQWKEELARRFRRAFREFKSTVPADLDDVDQLIASADTLKAAKFKDALRKVAPWDIVVFDEAHHLATTTSVLTYQLAQFLRSEKKARNLLFLTATPHSGNNEHFFNMLRLLREDLFPKNLKECEAVSLKQVMLRNRKSDVTDTKGQRIFKGIAPARIIPFAPAAGEVAFYEELREYLRHGYKVVERLQREKDGQRASAVGFLMSTFGKLASSSRAAIESALEKRRAALEDETQIEPSEEEADERFAGERAESLVATQAMGTASRTGKKRKVSLIENELARVEKLLESLKGLRTPDSKLTNFIGRVKTLGSDIKLLIFTEYRATQNGLVSALKEQFGDDCVVIINGSMKMPERQKQVQEFNERSPNPRFMVSTEAGGEGLNMQKACHTIVNYDLPWNPMVLQQRIGRVYRYGQQHPVVVFNLKVDSTSDAYADQRVHEYLERKIDEITTKLQGLQDGDPEDLRSEVLGQVVSTISLDELYKTAVEEGRLQAERQIDSKTGQIEQILGDPQGMLGMFRGLDRFDITDYEKVAARVKSDHLDFFVRQYLGHQGADCKVRDGLLSFRLPKKLLELAPTVESRDQYLVREVLTDTLIDRATVDKELAQRTPGCRLLRFGDAAFEAMVRHVQHGGFAEGVASLDLPAAALGWAPGIEGSWVLFELTVVRQEGSEGGARVLRRELASFVVPRGQVPTVRDEVVEFLHEGSDGPAAIDSDEARRAYLAGREAAVARLEQLGREAVKDYGNGAGILTQVQDVALAWVRSVGA